MYTSDPLRQAAAPRRALFLRHPFAAVLLGCPAVGALFGLASAFLTGINYHVPLAEFLLTLSGGFFSGFFNSYISDGFFSDRFFRRSRFLSGNSGDSKHQNEAQRQNKNGFFH